MSFSSKQRNRTFRQAPPRPIQREVIVVHVPSAKARRYQAGRGSSWNASFEDDLQALYFYTRPHSLENAT
jgi:hypothetical protein